MSGGASRWVDRAKCAAATLKSEYEAGKHGDDTPPETIWPAPRDQLDALLGLFKRTETPHDDSATESSIDADAETDACTGAGAGADADVTAVTAAMRGIDWADVRTATSERTGEAASAMRAAAAKVDWTAVQPVAAQVSSALIAAVASGRLGVGGPIGSIVARAIVDQGGLARRVASQLQREQGSLPTGFGDFIDTTARDSST